MLHRALAQQLIGREIDSVWSMIQELSGRISVPANRREGRRCSTLKVREAVE
jgi:hypothetical protein